MTFNLKNPPSLQSLRSLILYHVLETESRYLYSLYFDGERLNMYSGHGVLVKKG